jgi:hypothetical protein
LKKNSTKCKNAYIGEKKPLNLIFSFGTCMKIMIIIFKNLCETFGINNIVNIMTNTFVSQQNK